MADCGQRPESHPWIVCALDSGHEQERHESADFWWSDRQQIPVLKGHVHSVELHCTSACPEYGRLTRRPYVAW
jgi:hypothetical protein